MAKDLRLSDVAANAGINAIAVLLNGGTLKIYDGVRPATANTAITTQHLLSTVTFGTPACAPAVAGVVTFNTLGADPSIARSGTATWARLYEADGLTVVCDLSVGSAGCDINLRPSNSLVLGAPLSLDAGGTLTLPEVN